MTYPKPIDPKGEVFVPGAEITSLCAQGGKIRKSRVVQIEFETDPAVVASLLPSPLVPERPNVMTLSFNEMQGIYPDGEPRPIYREVVIGIPAVWKERVGTYNVQLLLDGTERGSEVAPTVAGVILYGYSKREATIDLEKDGTALDFTVSRRGKPVASGRFALGDDLPLPDEGRIPDAPAFGIKYVPSAEAGRDYDILKLLGWHTRDYRLTARRRVQILSLCEEIALDGSDHRIPVRKVLRCFYIEASFSMGPAEVVWDYLQPVGA